MNSCHRRDQKQLSCTVSALLCLTLVACSIDAARNPRSSTFIHSENGADDGASSCHVGFDEATGSLQFLQGSPAQGEVVVAEGNLSDASNHENNFGQLRISTHSAWPDTLQLRAAGAVEGWLTAALIYEYWQNYKFWYDSKVTGTEEVMAWIEKQDRWVLLQLHIRSLEVSASNNGDSSSSSSSQGGKGAAEEEAGHDDETTLQDEQFWVGMHLVMLQLEGLIEGYNKRVRASLPGKLQPLPRSAFLLMNAYGDLNDLFPKLAPGGTPEDLTQLDKLSPHDAVTRLATAGHCSALIRVTGDLQDIVMGHNTWSTYYSMVRLYKHYTLNLHSKTIKNKGTSLSGYPGVISSIDDFFILSSGLVVMETTNDIMDRAVYDGIVNEAAFSYQRVLVANMMAGSGAEWAEWVKMYNSGTYNNQFMIVDMKKFEPGQELKPGLLTVTELMPGFSVVDDVTQELERGHWPSYNVPYFKEVYDRMGYRSMANKIRSKGAAYSSLLTGLGYQTAPRAKIFRRDAGMVDSVKSMGQLLRHANWGADNDTYSGGSPWGTLCARGDLLNVGPQPYGCIDAKVTSYSMAMKRSALVVGGPSHKGGLDPFSWSKSAGFPKGPQKGMIDTYTTHFEVMEP